MGINTLQEFLDENLHRNYPVLDGGDCKDTTGQYNLPTELIADMRLIVPEGVKALGTFFISSLIVRRYTADIEISYKPDAASAFPIGWFRNMDTGAETFESYPFAASAQADPANVQFEDTTGTITAGTGMAAITLPGVWNFSEDSTPLVEIVPVEQLTKFRSVQVGNSVFTGNIVLKEGSNVSIATSYDLATDTTTITFSARESAGAGVVLTDDESIIDALTLLYGPPITAINEIPPETDGNFTLRGADCVVVTPETGGQGIRIENPCGIPCCDKETYLSPVYESINQLNSRHVRLEDFLGNMTVSLDFLLSSLKDLENAVGLGGF